MRDILLTHVKMEQRQRRNVIHSVLLIEIKLQQWEWPNVAMSPEVPLLSTGA